MTENIDYKKYREEGYESSEEVQGKSTLLKSHLKPLISQVIEHYNNSSSQKKNSVKIIEDEIGSLEGANQLLENELDSFKSSITDNSKFVEDEKQRKVDLTKNYQTKKEENYEKISNLRTSIQTANKSKESTYKSRFASFIFYPPLILLTIFLFAYYGSAIHTSFIRDIPTEIKQIGETKFSSPQEKSIALSKTTSIIHLSPFQDSWEKGGWYGILILLGTFGYPLTAGLLIYIFRHQRKFVYITFAFTFIFDAFLAYHLVHEIHNAKYQIGDIEEPWRFFMFLWDIRFYLILFIGFIGYIGWGILLEKLLVEKDKAAPYESEKREREADNVVAKTRFDEDINSANERIKELKDEIQDKELKVKEKMNEISKNNVLMTNKKLEIEKLDKKIPLPKAKTEAIIESYTSGWSKWIIQNLTKDIDKENDEIGRCQKVKEDFLNAIFSSNEYFFYE